MVHDLVSLHVTHYFFAIYHDDLEPTTLIPRHFCATQVLHKIECECSKSAPITSQKGIIECVLPHHNLFVTMIHGNLDLILGEHLQRSQEYFMSVCNNNFLCTHSTNTKGEPTMPNLN